MADGFGLHEALAILGLNKTFFPRLPYPLGDHIHGHFKVEFFPMGGKRTAVFHLQLTIRMGKKLKAVCAFRTEASTRDGRLRITLNGNQLVVFMEDELSAANATVRTHRTHYLGAISAWSERAGALGHGFRAGAISS